MRTTKGFILRLSVELLKQLDKEAKLQKSNRTEVVREALRDYLNGKDLERDYDAQYEQKGRKKS